MTQQQGQFTPGFGCGKFGSNFFDGAIPNPDILVSQLASGTSVSVFGLRRIGKTSLLAETRERLRSLEKNVIWVDLDTSDSPTKALSAILGAMLEGKCKGVVANLKNWVDNSEFVSAEEKAKIFALISGGYSMTSETIDYGYVDALLRQTGKLLEALDSESKPIIILDELTTLIKTTIDQSTSDETRQIVGRLNSFLGQLRHWRTDDVGIRMAVSGSESFNWLRREYGIRSDSINDCFPVFIKELDRDGAKKLIEMCVDAKGLTTWNKQLTEELLDFIPAFFPGVVQLAFRVVGSAVNPISKLDDSIRKRISDVLWAQYYDQLDSRFQRFGVLDRGRINKLFDALECRNGGIINTTEALEILNGVELSDNDPDGRTIINHLKSDSFIDIVPGGLRFSSGLVPAWRNNPNYQEKRVS